MSIPSNTQTSLTKLRWRLWFLGVALSGFVSAFMWTWGLSPPDLPTILAYFCNHTGIWCNLKPEPDCTAHNPATPAWYQCAMEIADRAMNPVTFDAQILYHHLLSPTGDYGPPKILNDGAILHSGDQYQLSLRLSKTARLYWFHRDGVGRLTGLSLGQHLEANQLILLPSPETSYTLDDEPGVERLYLLLLPDAPHPMLDRLTDAFVQKATGATDHILTLLDGSLQGHIMCIEYLHINWGGTLNTFHSGMSP